MSRVLVTGATGFIGTNLVPVLEAAGHEVVPFSLRGWTGEPFPEDVDVVVNLAGKAHDLDGTASPEVYRRINTDLAERAYVAFLASDAATFIQLSSVAAVNEATVDGVLDESAEPHPVTPYGKSKLAAERLLLAVEPPAGRRTIVLRPTMVHGPGDKGNLRLLFGLLSRGIPYPLDAFRNERSFVSIQNLTWAITSIIDTPAVTTGVYLVADDEPVSTGHLVTLIGEVTGRRVRRLALPPALVRLAAAVGDRVPAVPLNSGRLAKLTEDYRVSGARLLGALGHERMPTATDDGLRSSIAALAAERGAPGPDAQSVRSQREAGDR
ncbi:MULTISPECIES: NAD-dependent epimerase/dehydratase family protein [Plantibacter]|uniref:NAD-dependent epimerase/dehydratase family protein n=1 Tax=Plantibacter TaxID=190323 RepID=UPI0013758BDD|nr:MULTISPECIES: NAD-dependent epimerase/dehydratase family protein [Plantibacter]MBD8516720.1 NAD-dependent epimerase/dehydratase family protein [Plantibacter sp. CFBP 8804]